MKLTPIDIQQQQFGKRMRGYASDEVDAFLELVGEQLGELARENAELKADIHRSGEELAEHRDRETTLREAMLTAQQALDEIRDNAQKEAQLIVSEAELKAEKILHSAHSRVNRILEDVADLKKQRVRAIEEMRGVLATHVRLLEVQDESAAADVGCADASITVLERLRAPVPPERSEDSSNTRTA